MNLFQLTLTLPLLVCLGCSGKSSSDSGKEPNPQEPTAGDEAEQNPQTENQPQTEGAPQTGLDGFRGSCHSFFDSKLDVCTEFYGESADEKLSKCNINAGKFVEKTSTEKCPQANLSEKCDKEPLENGSYKIKFTYTNGSCKPKNTEDESSGGIGGP